MISPIRRSHIDIDFTDMILRGARHVQYVFDHAVYVRWGASLLMPSTFPRKGRGVGPGGSGGLPGCAGPLSFRAQGMVNSTAASPSRTTIMVQVGRSEPREMGSEQEAVHFWLGTLPSPKDKPRYDDVIAQDLV